MRLSLVLVMLLLSSFPVLAVQAHVYFNQTVYQMNSHANITVEDPDWNADPGSAEALYVTVNSTTSPAGIQVLLKETGADTGVFVAENPVFLNNISTDQNTLKLRVSYGDLVYVWHEDDGNAYTTNTTRISFNATIESDKVSYLRGDVAKITICDYDNSADNITAEAVSSYDSSSISFNLSYNSTSRCYDGAINISDTTDDNQDKILMEEGYYVEVKYLDPMRTDGASGYSSLILYSKMAGVLYFDDQYTYKDPSRKQYYSRDDRATIYVVDYDMNKNRKEKDSFTINVTGKNNNSLIHVVMTETGDDTGIFNGTFTFSESSGSDISDVLLVSDGDTINASYLDAESFSGQLVVWNMAKYYTTLEANITFNVQTIYPDTNLTITVNDPDRNVIGTLVDGIPAKYARVHSDSDTVGFNISLWETGIDTGIFTDFSLYFRNYTNPSNHTLNISDNDLFYFTYFDCKNAFCTDNITKTLNLTFRWAETARIVPDKTVVGSGDTVLITVYDNDSFVPSNPTVDVVHGDNNETFPLTPSSQGIYTTYVVPNINEGEIITIYYVDMKNSSGEVQVITKELKGLSNAYMNVSDALGNSVVYPNDTIKIVLKDVDRNEDESKTENITVNATALTIQQLTLIETSPNSGIFEGEFLASEVAANTSAGNGDNITISYYDPHNFTRSGEIKQKNVTYLIAYDPQFSSNITIMNAENNSVEINISDPDNTAPSVAANVSTSLSSEEVVFVKHGSVYTANITIPGTLNASSEDTVTVEYYDSLDSRGDAKRYYFTIRYDSKPPSANFSLDREYYGNGDEITIYLDTSEPVNISANFSEVDTGTSPTGTLITGSGTSYTIKYTISDTNSVEDGVHNATLILTDAANNNATLKVPIEIFRLKPSVSSYDLGEIKPGQSKKLTFYLENSDTSDKNVSEKIETCQNVSSFAVMPDSTIKQGPAEICMNYADTDFGGGTVKNQSSVPVVLTVDVPSNAVPGNYTTKITYTSDGKDVFVHVKFRVSAPSILLMSGSSPLAPGSKASFKYNLKRGEHEESVKVCNYGTENLSYSAKSSLEISYPNKEVEPGKCDAINITIPDSSSNKTVEYVLNVTSSDSSPVSEYSVNISVEYTRELKISNSGQKYHTGEAYFVLTVEYVDGERVTGLKQSSFSISLTSSNKSIPFSISEFSGNSSYYIKITANTTASLEAEISVSDGKGNKGTLVQTLYYAGEIPSNLSCAPQSFTVTQGVDSEIGIVVENRAIKDENITISIGNFSGACRIKALSSETCSVKMSLKDVSEKEYDVMHNGTVLCRARIKVVPNQTTIGEMLRKLEAYERELAETRERIREMEQKNYDVGSIAALVPNIESQIKAAKSLIESGEYYTAYTMMSGIDENMANLRKLVSAAKKRMTALAIAMYASFLLFAVVGIYLALPQSREMEKRLIHRIRVWWIDMKIRMKMRRMRK